MFARELADALHVFCSVLFYTHTLSLLAQTIFLPSFFSTSSFIVRYYSLFVHNLMDMHAAAAAAPVAWLE